MAAATHAPSFEGQIRTTPEDEVGEHLNALDATFLELEEADQSAHMHIGGVILMEPRSGGMPPLDAVREDIAARLPDLPRYRERLSTPETGGLHWPTWEQDTGFDIARHVFAAGLPAPGGRDELIEWAGDFYSARLDRTKPLWEIAVIELSHGRWALATKTHHCLVDGVGSVDIGTTLLDSEPERRFLPPPPDQESLEAEAAEDRRWLRRVATRVARPGLAAARAGARAFDAGLHAAEGAAGIVTHPGRIRDSVRHGRALVELIVRDELVAAPRTSLNDPIGAKRRLAVMEASLDELKEVRGALGGTVNDVVLAIAAGGLRRLLLSRGEELPEQGLRAMVPVNVRTAAEKLALGNRISSLFVHVPVAPEDPAERYRLQLGEAEELKQGTQAEGSTTLLNLASHMPPVLHSFVARSLFATRLFNVTITNVPGPQQPLYCFGARVREIWPLVPIAAEHAVGLAVFSYDGTLFFCVNADRDSCRDLDVLSEGMRASLRELHELVTARRAAHIGGAPPV
jgi:WS/DGAT/MGAT family acyltransferase